jgi:hypothetical protein
LGSGDEEKPKQLDATLAAPTVPSPEIPIEINQSGKGASARGDGL